MRVLFTSTSYPASAQDWHGVFIAQMLDGLAKTNEFTLHTWCPPGPQPVNVECAHLKNDADWFNQLTARGGLAHLLRRHPMTGLMRGLQLIQRLRRVCLHVKPDLFHVNWLQCVLGLLLNNTPVLVTVLGSDMQLLRLPGMRAALRRTFRSRRVAICPNAEWMVPALQAAFGDAAVVRCVPFGIDARWYAVERRFEANAVPKWLCVSRLTRGKLGPLFEWTEPAFAHGKAELHLFGPMQEQVELPAWVHWHGPASPDDLCATWFPQAHGLVTLSRHAEGRPQVMLEALAAGLPIVASRLPAHADLLGEGDGGMLCDSASATLAAIDHLSDPVANRTLGLAGRARMQSGIGTWDDCAGRYAALYRQLLADRG